MRGAVSISVRKARPSEASDVCSHRGESQTQVLLTLNTCSRTASSSWRSPREQGGQRASHRGAGGRGQRPDARGCANTRHCLASVTGAMIGPRWLELVTTIYSVMFLTS